MITNDNILSLRKQFPTINDKRIYLDNASSAFTPVSVIQAITEYYTKYSCNLYRGEDFLGLKLSQKIEDIRKQCAQFINASLANEIIFTPGATYSSNMIINILMDKLKPGDEVVLTKHAHSSLFAPILKLSNKKKILVKYFKLDNSLNIDLKKVPKVLNNKTKIVFLSHVTNVYGLVHPVRKIKSMMKTPCPDAFLVVDAAQSIPYLKVDVNKLDCDFLFFSAHKMFGPTGVGVLYGKSKLLKILEPHIWGGGQITNFLNEKEFLDTKDHPYKFEAGTLPLAGILGLGAAISFIENIKIENINNRIMLLTTYLWQKLRNIKFIKVYSNPNSHCIVFNVKDYPVHDVVTHLSAKGISVRGGQHCAQLLTTITDHPKTTIRVSLQFYNTYWELDQLCKELIEGRKEHYLGGFL